MYYFSEQGVTKQYNDAKQYVIDYAKYLRSQFGEISFRTLKQIVNFVKDNFKISLDIETDGEDRLAEFLSGRQGSVHDFADLLLLILYDDPGIRVYKFNMAIATNMHGSLAKGSTVNPIKHVGICFKIECENLLRERYIDLSKSLDSLFDIEIFTNEDLRKYYNFDYHFAMFSSIENIKAKNISEYYDGIINRSSIPMPRNKI